MYKNRESINLTRSSTSFNLHIQSIVNILFVNTPIGEGNFQLSNRLLGHAYFKSNSMNFRSMYGNSTNSVSVARFALIFVIDYLPQHSSRYSVYRYEASICF